MASNQTQFFHLNQWQAEDAVLRADFNSDNTKLDAALRALDTGKASAAALSTLEAAVTQKANQNALTSLQTTVSGKANQSDLTALSGKVTALESKQTADVTLLREENPWAALLNVAVTTATDSITVPLTGITVSKYRELHIVTNCFTTTLGYHLRFQLNQVTSGYRSAIDVSVGAQTLMNNLFVGGYSFGTLYGRVTLAPLGTTGTACIGFGASLGGDYCTNATSGGGHPSIAYRDLTSLRFFVTDYNTTIPAGSRFTIYGLKELN